MNHNSDREKALAALGQLSARRADDRETWLTVGMALHSVSPDLLTAWDSWSQQSEKFTPGECARQWKSFKANGGVTLGTLLAWARADSGALPAPMTRPRRPASAEKPKPAYPTLDAAIQAMAHVGKFAWERPYPGPHDFHVARFDLPTIDPETNKCKKVFLPFHKNGKGFICADPPGKLPLYRGDDLPADGPIIVTEGELKVDAARSIGLAAVTSSHGCESAHRSDWTPLAGRSIIILADNDPGGRRYAQEVAAILTALGAVVRIVLLPGLPPKGDIIDYVEARDGQDAATLRTEIEVLAAKAPTWTPTAEAPATEVTDVDLAEGDVRLGWEFATAFAERVRYCPDLESWLVWDDRRWAPDAVHAAERLMQNLARDRLTAAMTLGDAKTREAEARFWVQAMRRNRIEAALWAARSDPRLIVRLAALDADPWALNCCNGTLNLKTRELRTHNPADLITKLASTEYRPDADQSEWLRFFERVLPNPAVRSFLQEAVGYSATGLATEEVLFFGSGPTAGGKSTFVSAVGSALGDYAATANFATFLAQRNKSGPRPDIVRLAGKRFVSSMETEEGAQLAGGLLKWITGQDQLCERSLYQTEVEFLPTFSLWLVSNFRPKAHDDNSALWRRLMLLPFEVSIPEAERDPNVKARLRDPTIGGPAVLAWIIEGCLVWQKHGLQPPEPVKVATRQWRAENDPILDWLSERATLNSMASTAFKELNASYRQWAEESGLRPISGIKLGKRLQDHGCRKDPGAGNKCIYAGISLKS